MAESRPYKNLYPSVTGLAGLAVHFDPTGWYEGMRAKLKRQGANLNHVNPIQECKKVKEESIRIGHNIHGAIEKFLEGKSFKEVSGKLSEQEKVMLSYLTSWCSDHKVKLVATEKTVYYRCKKHKRKPSLTCPECEQSFAGTVDLICTVDGKDELVILDWKTDSTPGNTQQRREREAKYLWQASGYSIGYERESGVFIDRAIFVRISKKFEFHICEFGQEDLIAGREEFKMLRKLYKRVFGK